MKTRMFLCLSVLLLLQGCMSAAMTGASTVYNRQGLKATFKDQYITLKAYQKLELDNKRKEFANANVTVTAFNGEVLLAGQVPEAWQKDRAEEIVKGIPDVTKVYNVLAIASPSSTLTRVSDTWLTTKVKAQMIASEDMDGSKVKVVSENGTVYLMGLVVASQADVAVDIARHTTGVTQVVKMFSYLTITKKPLFMSPDVIAS